MGIIVSDEYNFDNGMTISNYYVNIDNITIKKSNLEEFQYTISADVCSYVSQEHRNQQKQPFNNGKAIITSDTINNVHTQIYTDVKTRYENYTDDI